MTIKTYVQGDLVGAMRRWDPIRLTPAKNYNNDNIWETIEQTGLKTKYFKKNRLVSTQTQKDAIENHTLLLEDIADPFGDLKAKLDILG